MKYLAGCCMVALSLISSPLFAQTSSLAEETKRLAQPRPLVAPHIRVASASQFTPWTGRQPRLGKYGKEGYERSRLGTLAFGPGLQVHVDLIRDTINFPSYYELIHARSGKLLGKYAIFEEQQADWYFPGDGTAHLHQRHLALCGPWYDRKLVWKGNALVEEHGDLILLTQGETEAESPTRLYATLDRKKVVATLDAGEKATVLGLHPLHAVPQDRALYVMTRSGLTGWHIARNDIDDGRLMVYLCN
jgi:hypothetical protein